jgi:hypothetical protein
VLYFPIYPGIASEEGGSRGQAQCLRKAFSENLFPNLEIVSMIEKCMMEILLKRRQLR